MTAVSGAHSSVRTSSADMSANFSIRIPRGNRPKGRLAPSEEDAMAPGGASPRRNTALLQAAWLLGVVGMVLLRTLHLDSDAYPRLSWSSALLTDEGFYLHNARNLLLFGHLRTDGFNNRLIMPLLHLMQVGLFRLIGMSLLNARLLSVGCSLLTLWLFHAALHRGFGGRVARMGVLFLGLDHANLLYNRLALMDTPATLFLVGGLWAFTKGVGGWGLGMGLRA